MLQIKLLFISKLILGYKFSTDFTSTSTKILVRFKNHESSLSIILIVFKRMIFNIQSFTIRNIILLLNKMRKYLFFIYINYCLLWVEISRLLSSKAFVFLAHISSLAFFRARRRRVSTQPDSCGWRWPPLWRYWKCVPSSRSLWSSFFGATRIPSSSLLRTLCLKSRSCPTLNLASCMV